MHIFLFLNRHPLAPLYPLPYENVRDFLRQSRIFVHTSFIEGECRVITEALAAGCFIVANKQLVGSGLDYLNNENSLLFDSFDDLLPTLKKALIIQQKVKLDNKNNIKSLLKSSSIEFLLNYMKENDFDFDNEHFYSCLSNIDLKYALAGHASTINQHIKGKWYLGTLLNLNSCLSYLENELEIKVKGKLKYIFFEFITGKPKLILNYSYFILRKQFSQLYRLIREKFLVK